MLDFEERGKPEYPGKNLSEQRREPTTTKFNIQLVGGERSRHCAIPAPKKVYLGLKIDAKVLHPVEEKVDV